MKNEKRRRSQNSATSRRQSCNSASLVACVAGVQVTPGRGEFINFDVDTTYVMSFSVCNRSHVLQTIRFMGPQATKMAFRLVNTESVRLAPGLTHVVDVEFSTHFPQDCHDSFTVLLDDKDSLEVPLAALSVPELKYNSVVDFGRVEYHRTGGMKQLQLLNRGRKDAFVSMAVTSAVPGLTINPTSVLAKALSETAVTFELAHHIPPGQHEWQIAVTVDEMTATRPLKAIVDVVDSRSTLIDTRTGTEAVSVVFNKAYSGTTTRYPLRVINGSEQGVSFAFQLGTELYEKDLPPFRFVPEQARLGPKGTLDVVVLFEPPLSPIRQGWSCRQEASCRAATTKFENLFSLLFVETEQTHSFHVSAESIETVLSLSKSVIDFGECATNDYRTEDVVLRNGVSELSLSYAFDLVSNFRISQPTGTIPPKGEVTLTVTYQPRRMGKFSERLKVVLNGTVSRVITLLGYAVASTGKAKLVGGVNKLPIDFVRRQQPPNVPRHKVRAYTDALEAPATLAAVDLPKEVDIGMVPGEGLRPPNPVSISGSCQKDLLAEDAGIRLTQGHVAPVTFDTKSLIRRRYAEEPMNALERRDCRRELMPMDLLKVVTPIKVVDFENVTVGAASTKSFFVYNGTNASIIVTMPAEEPHLHFSPLTQVIPTSRMGHFDVCLCSSVVQSCQQVIPFTINTRHQMRFTLVAEVVPVEVTLSQSDIVLHFAEFADDPVAQAHVSLHNNGNSSAPFRFIMPPGKVPFRIDPAEGVLEPMSKLVAEITFVPPQGVLEINCEVFLEVEGALENKKLHLHGVVAATQCVWNKIQSSVSGDAVLDLRRIPAGRESPTTLTLHNRGTNNAYYSFDTLPPGIHVTPATGRVCTGESEELTVTVCLEAAGPIQQTVLCSVRGMRKPLRILVSANVVVPPLFVTAPELVKGEVFLDFNEVYVGWQEAREITFSNQGDVAAVIEVDLRTAPHYQLVCKNQPKGLRDTTSVSLPDISPEVTQRRWSISSHTSSDSALSEEDHSSVMESVYLATIPAQTEVTIAVVFTPEVVSNRNRCYVHWRQIGADDIHPLPPLVLSAVALPTRLRLSTSNVQFPSVVSGRLQKPVIVTLTNVSSQPASWALQPNCQAHFLVEPNAGAIAPNAATTITITFLANDVGHFVETLLLLADGDQSKICAGIQLQATATQPRLISSVDRILFPTIPLETVVCETVVITNEGFDNIQVIYDGDSCPPVKVTFPAGGNLSQTLLKIPVEVSFSSPKPITVSSSIVLRTSTSESITIAVSGTAINSIMATQGFVRHLQYVVGHDAADWCPEEAEVFQIRGRKHDRVTFPPPEEGTVGTMAAFHMVDAVRQLQWSRGDDGIIALWLSNNLIRRQPSNLVETLQGTHGRILYDAIERIFGKRPRSLGAELAAHTVTGPASGSRMKPPIINARTLRHRGLQFLETLLAFMKQYGCCLSAVEINYLLTYEEYAGNVQDDRQVLSPDNFNQRAMHAWSTVVLEVLRVFYLSKFTPEGLLRVSPQISTVIPSEIWCSKGFREILSGSTVYSTEESCLLQWVRATVGEYGERDGCFPFQKLSVANFDDLRDVRSFVAVVLTFIPSMRSLFGSANKPLVTHPVTVAEMESNAQLFLNALQELGITGQPTMKEYMEFTQTDFVLFTAFMATYIPKFVPSDTILFEGRLLAPITKSIEISNWSSSARQYRVQMESAEFKPSCKELIVAANSSINLGITFTPRYHRVVEGTCLIIDNSPVPPEYRVPLAFHLRAAPNSEPTKVMDYETPLYEPLNINLSIESPFTQDCVVGVSMTQQFVETQAPTGGINAPPSAQTLATLKKCFFVTTDVLPLRRSEPTSLSFHCIPFFRGSYEAVFTFRDDREGEFSYLVRVQCIGPKAGDTTIEFRAELGEECHPSLQVKSSNPALERAARLYEDKQRQSQSVVRAAPNIELAGSTYTVSFLNEALEEPNPFFVYNEGHFTLPTNGSPADLRFDFIPKYVGKYNGYVMLSSPIDVRLIRFVGECVPAGERCTIHFACPARQSISQELTITNHSEGDWLFSATLEGECFSGPRELRIPKGKQKDYVIKYSPPWISAGDTGSLVLLNKSTGQRHTYELKAEAEAPLCEDILYVECRAREQQKLTLTVPNVSANGCTYFVETDLPFTEGEATVITRRASFAKYELIIMPTVGGTYCGKVVFKSLQGRYVWYVVNLSVTPPDKEGTVELNTDLRTTIVAQVTISNPLPRPLNFFVRRYGPGLIGNNSLEIATGEVGTYNCTFAPVQVGDFTGRLSFCHDEIGEFWYELKMHVVDSEPEKLTFESALGVPQSNHILLPNRSDTECPLMVENSCPAVFSVSPNLITIPAHSEAPVEIIYTPTAVGVPQAAIIKLSHPMLGQWKYACTGTGTSPPPGDLRSCVCEMLSTTTIVIPVTNTLGVATPIDVKVTDNKENFFAVRSTPPGPIQPGATTTVTLVYAPQSVGNHTATVEVRPVVDNSEPQHGVCWTYPLQGRSEWRETSSPFRFHCAARKEVTDLLVLRVPGLTLEEKVGATLRFEPDPRQHYLSAVNNSFECSLVNDCPYPDAFQAHVKFTPLRPMAASGDLVIEGPHGGCWRYRVYLEASTAPMDDTIHLVSTLYNPTSVVFDLYNVFPYKSKFVAYFTSDSSKDFGVAPAHGVLLPFVSGQRVTASATPLKIRYRPSTRVPRVEGTLVVDTEDMQWSFRVIGKLDSQSKR